MRRDALRVIALVAAIAVGAQLSVDVPVGRVPVTGQTLALLVGAALLRPPLGVLGAALYMFVAALGAPVLARGAGGLAEVLDAPLGYLVGFVVAAWIVGGARDAGFARILGAQALGTAVVLALGGARLCEWMSVAAAYDAGVRPFLPGAALKVAVGAGLVWAWRRQAFNPGS